ncbi:MAG: hypothetical protein CVV15_05930 [Gammaproteobacteria bacterium HGW-Gammaproteobacteria-5]|nr:MAG: hypothetical protein CVV15_05930 [Gammaproteobacteria bacterium HGW-Gammaproteobacteria-5]
MNEPVLIATAALLITSLLVRVLPVFIRMPIGAGGLRVVGQILPTSVFINLAVYVAYSEISAAPVAAATSLLAVALLAIHGRLGIVGSMLFGTALYYTVAGFIG